MLLSSVLILTSPLLDAGLLFTSLLYAVLCVGFVDTSRLLGAKAGVATFAALVILLHPLLNDSRTDILGEAGYWAFSLLALQQLISYNRNLGWSSQLRWLAYTGIAGLFSAEGLLFTVLTPLVLLFTLPRRQRLKGMLRLLVPALALVGALLASGVVTGIAGVDANRLADAGNAWNHFVAAQTGSIAGDAGVVAFGALLTLVLLTVLRTLGMPVLALMAWGYWRRWTQQVPAPARIIINLHLLVGLLPPITAGILGTAPDARQSGLVVIFLLLYFPFILDALWSHTRPRLLTRGLVIAVLVSLAAASVHEHRQRHAYIAEAGEWLRQHTETDSSLLSNVEFLIWLNRLRGSSSTSASPDLSAVFTDDAWQRHRYLAIWERRGLVPDWYSFAKTPGIQVRRIFLNQPGDYQIVIFENTDYREDQPESLHHPQ